MGLPTFYDKLPLLNLSIRGIDRMVQSRFFRSCDPANFAPWLLPVQKRAAFMTPCRKRADILQDNR